MKAFFPSLALLASLPLAAPTLADTFGTGANTFSIDFVTIGDPGNSGDLTGSPYNGGAVAYEYRIGKYEISEDAIDKANALGGLGISHDGRGANKPATSISWFEAARFVNWLNTSTGGMPAYKFDINGDFQLWEPGDAGYDPNNRYRNSQAQYVLPSAHEWYKAAYFDPVTDTYFDYPTGSDTVPDGIDFVGDPVFDAVYRDPDANAQPNDISNVGVLSPFGTAGQGGNVFEWLETAFDLVNDLPGKQRGLRGGGWTSTSSVLQALNSGIGTLPAFTSDKAGFRVLHIPEPSSLALTAFGALSLAGVRRSGRRGCHL